MASSGHGSGHPGEKASKHQKRRARKEESVTKSEDVNGYRGDASIDELLTYINGSGNSKASKKKGVKEANRDAGIKTTSKAKNGPKPSQMEPKPETAQ